jgi:hypothetical protein
MRNIRRRLKELSKSFPPLKDTGPERLCSAVLTHLSEEELLLLLDIIDKQELSPVPPLTEPELRALEAYNNALALASRLAAGPPRLK